MFTYTIKRLLQSLIVVWAAVTLMFALFFIIPGDPISLKSGETLPPEIWINREKVRLDKPTYVRISAFGAICSAETWLSIKMTNL